MITDESSRQPAKGANRAWLRHLAGLAILAFIGLATEARAQSGPVKEYIYAGDRLICQQTNFADVPPANGFYDYVNILAKNGITSGCGGANYCPTSNVTREAMAKFLLLSKQGAGYTPPACIAGQTRVFADVPETNGFCPFIEEVYRRGITSGCAANPLRYCPSDTVTREQMSKFLLKTLDPALNPPACVAGQEQFTDVPATNGFCPWIEELKRRAITSGCYAPTLYCPADFVTREAMAKFLTLTFGLI